MYQVFYQEDSIIILNDDTGKTRILDKKEEVILFENNALLKDLKSNKTKRIFLDNIHGIDRLP